MNGGAIKIASLNHAASLKSTPPKSVDPLNVARMKCATRNSRASKVRAVAERGLAEARGTVKVRSTKPGVLLKRCSCEVSEIGETPTKEIGLARRGDVAEVCSPIESGVFEVHAVCEGQVSEVRIAREGHPTEVGVHQSPIPEAVVRRRSRQK